MRSLGNALWDLHIECAEAKVGVKARGKRGRPDLSRIVLEVGGIVVVSYRSNQFRSENLSLVKEVSDANSNG